MTEGLSARAARGSLWLGLVNLLSKGSQVATTIALAAFLTEADLGVATVAVALVNVGQVLQSMGVYDVIARTERDAKVVAGTLMTMSVCVGAVLAAIAAVGAAPIAGCLGAPGQGPLVALAAASLPFSAAGGVQMALMHRTLNFRQRLVPDSGSAIIGATVTVVLAAAGAGAYSLAIGLLCTAILQPILGLLVGVRIGFRWNRPAATEAFRWIRIVGPAAFVATLLVNVDYPVISRVLGTDAVGVYSVAFRIAWVPYIMMAIVIGAVAFPVYSEMLRGGQRDGIPRAVGVFTNAVLLVAGGAYALIAIMANHVVLLGERWAGAIPVLILLCGYGIGISLLSTWFEAIRAVGHIRWYLYFEIAHLTMLVITLLLFTRHGIITVGVVQLAVAWSMVPVVFRSLRAAGIAPPAAGIWRAVIGLVLPAAVALAASQLLRRTGLLGPDTSLAAAAIELTVVLTCFALVAIPANMPVLRELWQLRTKKV